MELQQLRYFMAVAKHRNFTRAAQECRVSQPGLSVQIQKLEAELGGPLFHRQGRTISMTEIGDTLLDKAELMLRLHQGTLDELKDLVSEGGISRIGATLTIAPYLVPHLIGEGVEEGIPEFEMEENFTENLLQKLLDGSLDFALMSTPVDEPKLLVKIIAKEPFVLVMPNTHRLAQLERVTMEEALKEPFLPLSQIHCAGRQVGDFYRNRRHRVKTVFESAQIETILKLLERGQGVSLLPKMAVLDSLSKRLCFRQVHGARLEREISLVHHPDRYLSQSTRRLMRLIEQKLTAFVGS